MAHHAEPMDIDSDFDNKENSLHHNNVLPFTEKGYEELDVSELNMKLRYSVTPASSPMSKSYTANSLDNRSFESGDDILNVTINEHSNLTRSLNSNMTKNDSAVKSLKALPLQNITTDQFSDNNRSTSVLRPLDTAVTEENANITVTISGPSDIDENLSLPSSSSSVAQTPEAITPTKDNKNDGDSSPIMRGIKSVLNMFRSSQSPIPTADSDSIVKPDILSPVETALSAEETKTQAMLASTPISAHRKKETSPIKRNSPQKESIVFNEDLEKELQWKDETTILFSQERIPIHKLFYQHTRAEVKNTNQDVELPPTQDVQDDINSTVEYMDISFNDSIRDRTINDAHDNTNCTFTGESDAEFVDCETTFTRNDSLQDDNDKTPMNDKTQDLDLTKQIESTNENTSASRLKQIILNTTQDILDATLSITPEDLMPEALLKTYDKSGQQILDQNVQPEIKEVIIPSDIELAKANETIDSRTFLETQDNSITSQENLPLLNETLDRTIEDNRQSIDEYDELNVTITAENVIQSILEQAMETKSMTSTEYDVNKIMQKISSETITFDSQHNILEHFDSATSSETFILNEKQNEDLRRQSTNADDHNLTQNIGQDIEPNKTDFDTTKVMEHNSSNLAETANKTINNPETLEEIVIKSLLNPDDEGKSSPIKETSMTELAAEIPLPDEDDLEKDLDLPADQTAASTLPISLPLDLVDHIKDQTVVTNTPKGQGLVIHNLTLEKEEKIIDVEGKNEDKIVLPKPLPLNISNLESSDNIKNEKVTLESAIIDEVLEVIADVDVKDELPPVTEEPQVVTVDVLPETAPKIKINMEMEDKIDPMQDNPEVLNKTETVTECFNETVTYHSEDKKRLSHSLDINESVIRPLPDIINQTNIVHSVENFLLAQNIPEPVMLEQQTILPENPENLVTEVISPEIVPEAEKNVPELLSDVSVMSTHANESTKVIEEELPIIPANNEIAKQSVTDGTTTIAPEHLPVATKIATDDISVAKDTVTDTQLNKVDVMPKEPVMPDCEKQPIKTDIPVCNSTDIKTEDDEIVLSENHSPFVSVIADDIPGMPTEENIDVQNIDLRLATAGKVVFTPPASPPIASKGYNFNFDEMDDPFATKTKIRVSPSLDTPIKDAESKASSISVDKPKPKREIMNRRKSQPERKKPVAPKRKFNSTFSDAVSEKTAQNPIDTLTVDDRNLEPLPTRTLEPSNVTIEDKLIEEAKIVHEKTLDVAKEVHKFEQELKHEVEQPFITSSANSIEPDESATIFAKDLKSTSLSDQSAYFSAGASSSESFHSRNVFNIPEIDDMNFNPFATKSKMRQSPPPNLDMENPLSPNSEMRNSDTSMIIPNEIVKAQDSTTTALPDDKMEIELMDTELMEKDGSGNVSNTTTSSKATDDKNVTIKEVNTEDEDTIEGPMLEAEDLNADDKMSDFDGDNIDMMQFNDLPTHVQDDNGELFIDAEAFEFLLNQNKSNTVVDSGKESLFLKFDPLFDKRMSSITSESLVTSLNKIQKRQSTPTKVGMPEKEVKSPIAEPSNLNITQEMDMTHNSSEEFNEDFNITVSKPMMIVPPAVNPVTPRNKLLTPTRSNRRSITFMSPAMAVIDRLLSLSGNSSPLHDTTVTHATREQNEANLALTHLRELLAEKEINVASLRSESKQLRDRLTSLETHVKSLEDESQGRLKKINDLNDVLVEKTKINKSMASVVEEYERTIASLISETAQDKKRHAEERAKLINERDEQTAHLASMEASFSDLHSKYEKSKQVILNLKANEDAYKKSIKSFEENFSKMQSNYELLKQHATSKLNHANEELDKINRLHEAEVLKLNTMIKRKELHITSLEESLTQKTKANDELTAICDELINKVV